MPDAIHDVLHEQLSSRRDQLIAALHHPETPARIRTLLGEVDAALLRMETGRFGLCDACGDPIESDRLLADPLARLCLDHLTPAERSALEQDLSLAVRIQRSLLPAQPLRAGAWTMAYQYRPLRFVSGDYCDALPGSHGDWYFLLGDVAGKGVAAAMLMTQLHAMFRALVPAGLPLHQLVERASSIFCESTLPSHYATLVSVRAQPDGTVEVCSAGHLPPLLVRRGIVTQVDTHGLPVGMFCATDYATTTLRMEGTDALLLYTDGLSEAEDASGNEFGIDRIAGVCAGTPGRAPDQLISDVLAEIDAFRDGPPQDDITVVAITRGPGTA